MGPLKEEFQKWQKWARRIKDDVSLRLVEPRQVFRGFAEVVNGNRKHITRRNGGVFCELVKQGYVAQVAMAIRSHVKVDKDSISLMRLLVQLRDNAQRFTFTFFLEQFPRDPNYVDWQTGTFGQFSEDGRTVSTLIVQSHIDQLKSLTSQVETMADRSIAHLDKRVFTGSLTMGDLDKCIDAFDKLVCKYLSLITSSGYATLEPTITFDWERIFRVPFDVRGRVKKKPSSDTSESA
jgi:hypothetical protein